MNLVGRTLGPYKLEAPLGKGGMAAVYRAYQASVRRYVAIKVMASEIANEPGFVERFEREAQIIASIEHPHILPVIDFGVADNVHYIVMRFMDGGSLDDLLRQRRLTLPEVATFLSQIASALDHAHKKGIVHRDLKPNNVLLDKENNCYLTDFGIARMEGSDRRLTATGSVMGTPSYMSPEQAMGRPVDARSDIYTLGVMLYEMTLGVLPFTADTPAALIFQHVYESPKPPKQIDPRIPDTVAAVIDRALAKNPDARYQTAGELSHAFTAALSGVAPTAPITPPGGYDKTFIPGTSQPNVVLSPITPTTSPQAWSGATTPPGAGTQGMPPAGTAYPQATVGAPPAAGRRSSGLILAVGALIVVLVVVAVVLILNNNNQNQIASQTQAVIAQTQTQVALVLSYTKTFTPSATFTSTHTPTPTNTLTPTIDTTGTAIAVLGTQVKQTAAAIALRDATSTEVANRTATANANLTGTANAVRQTQVAATQTAAVATATPTSRPNLVATANAIRTATALAAPPVSPTIPPTKVGVVPTPSNDPDPGLVSDSSDTVLKTLQSRGLVPTSGRIYRVPINDTAPQLTGQTTVENIFFVSRFSRSQFYDFAMSVDVAISSSQNAIGKTACGIVYNGRNERYTTDTNSLADMDMVVVYLYRNQSYGLSIRSSQNWKTPAANSGTSKAIVQTNNENNRLVVVSVGGQVTAFINGVQIFQQEEKTYDGGYLGYFMLRGATGNTERCQFSNISVWRINQ